MISRGRKLHRQIKEDLDNMTPYPKNTIKSHIFPKAHFYEDNFEYENEEDLNKSSLILGFKKPKKIIGGCFGKA